MRVYANVAFLRELGKDLQINWLHTLLDNISRESGNDGVTTLTEKAPSSMALGLELLVRLSS